MSSVVGGGEQEEEEVESSSSLGSLDAFASASGLADANLSLSGMLAVDMDGKRGNDDGGAEIKLGGHSPVSPASSAYSTRSRNSSLTRRSSMPLQKSSRALQVQKHSRDSSRTISFSSSYGTISEDGENNPRDAAASSIAMMSRRALDTRKLRRASSYSPGELRSHLLETQRVGTFRKLKNKFIAPQPAATSLPERCRCCGSERAPSDMSLLADGYRFEPLDANMRPLHSICKWCHAYCVSLLSPLVAGRTQADSGEKINQYFNAFRGSLSLPVDYVGVRERVEALREMIAASSSNSLKISQELASFVPGIVLWNLVEKGTTSEDICISGNASVLIADISGFTRLTERLCSSDGGEDDGAEKLTQYLNDFFTKLIDCIHRHGGDVYKFAGDALICVWLSVPVDGNARKHDAIDPALPSAALLCAWKLKNMVYDCRVGDDIVSLTLHCGLSTGRAGIISTGDDLARQLVITGGAVRAAGVAEGHAPPRSVVVCPSTWDHVSYMGVASAVKGSADGGEKPSLRQKRKAAAATSTNSKLARMLGINADSVKNVLQEAYMGVRSTPREFITSSEARGKASSGGKEYQLIEKITTSASLQMVPKGMKKRQKHLRPRRGNVLRRLASYAPASVVSRLKAGERSLADVRVVTTLFVKLNGMENNAIDMMALLQEAFARCLVVIRKADGMVRQFIVDDKGCVLIVCFGVANHTHQDDASRAIITAVGIKTAVAQLSPPVTCSVGLSTGRAFCGVVGASERSEYAVVGDCVNLAARLMTSSETDIICDAATKVRAENSFYFEKIPGGVRVKGKRGVIDIYKPLGRTVEGRMSSVKEDLEEEDEEEGIDATSVCLGRHREKENIQHTMLSFMHNLSTPTILIQGAEGIGKSLLLKWTRQCVEKEAPASLVLYGQCSKRAERVPLGGMRDILSALLPADALPSRLASIYEAMKGTKLTTQPVSDTARKSRSSTEKSGWGTKQNKLPRRSSFTDPTPPSSRASDDSLIERRISKSMFYDVPASCRPDLERRSSRLASADDNKANNNEIEHSDSKQSSFRRITANVLMLARPGTVKQFFKMLQTDQSHLSNLLLRGIAADKAKMDDVDELREGSLGSSMTIFQRDVHANSDTIPLPRRGSTESDSGGFVSEALAAKLVRLAVLLELARVTSLEERKVAIFVDSAHWLDDLSWGLLLDIAHTIPGALVVAATRSTAGSVQNFYIRRMLQMPFTLHLNLGALRRSTVVALIRKACHARHIPSVVIDAVMKSSNGHPLWAVEAVRGMLSSGTIVLDENRDYTLASSVTSSTELLEQSMGVEGSLLERFDRLDPTVQDVMKRCCVINSSFTAEMIKDMFDFSPESCIAKDGTIQIRAADKAAEANTRSIAAYERDIKTLVSEGLLAMDTNTSNETVLIEGRHQKMDVYCISHDLIRNTVYKIMPRSQRRLYHWRAARWLEAKVDIRMMNHDELMQLVDHYEQSKDARNLTRCIKYAASESFASGFIERGCEFLIDALNLMDGDESKRTSSFLRSMLPAEKSRRRIPSVVKNAVNYLRSKTSRFHADEMRSTKNADVSSETSIDAFFSARGKDRLCAIVVLTEKWAFLGKNRQADKLAARALSEYFSDTDRLAMSLRFTGMKQRLARHVLGKDTRLVNVENVLSPLPSPSAPHSLFALEVRLRIQRMLASFFGMRSHDFIKQAKCMVAVLRSMPQFNSSMNPFVMLITSALCSITSRYRPHNQRHRQLTMTVGTFSSAAIMSRTRMCGNVMTVGLLETCAVCLISMGLWDSCIRAATDARMFLSPGGSSSLVRFRVGRKGTNDADLFSFSRPSLMAELQFLMCFAHFSKGRLVPLEKELTELYNEAVTCTQPQVVLWADAMRIMLIHRTSFVRGYNIEWSQRKHSRSSSGGSSAKRYWRTRSAGSREAMAALQQPDLELKTTSIDTGEVEITEPFQMLDISSLAAADKCVAHTILLWTRGENMFEKESQELDKALVRESFERLTRSPADNLVWYLSIAYEALIMTLLGWVANHPSDDDFDTNHILQLCSAFRLFSKTFKGCKATCKRLKGYYWLLVRNKANAIRSWRKGITAAERNSLDYEKDANAVLASAFQPKRDDASVCESFSPHFTARGCSPGLAEKLLDHAHSIFENAIVVTGQRE